MIDDTKYPMLSWLGFLVAQMRLRCDRVIGPAFKVNHKVLLITQRKGQQEEQQDHYRVTINRRPFNSLWSN